MGEHHITLERRPHDRIYTCTCGWQSDPIPYGHTSWKQGVAAVFHTINPEEPQP